jgi:hypothetical protein
MKTHDLRNTVIGADYLKNKAHGHPLPPIDCFLDFMNKVKELKSEEEHPSDWYDKEIEATKFILSMETGSC